MLLRQDVQNRSRRILMNSPSAPYAGFISFCPAPSGFFTGFDSIL